MILQKLSVIIPCFNEAGSIDKILDKVLETALRYDIGKEIIVVNDGSTDATADVLKAYCLRRPEHQITVVNQSSNMGKGAAIKTALRHVSGEIVVIQDADLEYDPDDYNLMLKPIMGGQADVVYGSRFAGTGPHRVLFYHHALGNKFLTAMSNIFTQINLTDMETGYKMFRNEVLQQVSLKEKRFGFEPEVTAKISRIKNIRIYEVAISYYGRTYEEGKKIKVKDGLWAIFCILKYNLFSRK